MRNKGLFLGAASAALAVNYTAGVLIEWPKHQDTVSKLIAGVGGMVFFTVAEALFVLPPACALLCALDRT